MNDIEILNQIDNIYPEKDVDTEDIRNYCLKMEHLQKVLDAIEESK